MALTPEEARKIEIKHRSTLKRMKIRLRKKEELMQVTARFQKRLHILVMVFSVLNIVPIVN
jgi:hypothetical protein